MRKVGEILFKGKSLLSGEWVEGYLVRHPSAIQIGDDYSPWYIHVPPTDPDDSGGVFNVVPSTVCEWTGLTDCKGRKIWEGDKITGLFLHGQSVTATVGFRDGSFGAKWHRGVTLEFSPFTSVCNVEWEVIGNIHDEEGGQHV